MVDHEPVQIACGDPLASQAIEEIEGGYPLASVVDLESIARVAYVRCPHGTADGEPVDVARAVAVLNRVPVIEDRQLPGEAPAALMDGTIYVRPHKDPKRLALLILHELAHALLERARMMHSHADVWYLTMALAIPREVLDRMRLNKPVNVRAWPVWVLGVRLAVEMDAVA